MNVSLPSLSNVPIYRSLSTTYRDALCSLLVQLTMDQQRERVRDDAIGRIIVLDDDNNSSSSSSDDEDHDDGQRAAYDDSTVLPSDFSEATSFDGGEEYFVTKSQKLKENDPHTIKLRWAGEDNYYNQNITNENWEQLGHDISNNTHLKELSLHKGALNDTKMSCLFRGLTKSSTIKQVGMYANQLSAAGVRSMVPFLQNSTSLVKLDLSGNNFQSEGFNVLLRALQNSPIQKLFCCRCGINSINIDRDHIPKQLTGLSLNHNSISADGCRELAKLLHGRDAILKSLNLRNSDVDDEGVEILVDPLQNNKSLKILDLGLNSGISRHGNIMLLKLVNDISSIEATLRSNHSLISLSCSIDADLDRHIKLATTRINRNASSPEAAGRAKVIQTQLHSVIRAKLTEIQGVNHSVYSEIDPLHLPEVLALVGRHHGQKELYIALKSSIAGLISTVNIAEAAQGGRAEDGESRSSKRRRKWWWGLWGRA